MKKITILGKSDATISLVLNNLESCGFYPEISIINNLNLEIFHDFNNPKFNIEIFNKLETLNDKFVIGGYSPSVKKSLFNEFNINREKFINVIHKSSEISSTVKIGNGVLINALVSIAPHTVIGDFVSVNGNVLIGHHILIEDFVTLNPSCTIAGHCHIGKGTTIGMGANVLNGIKIGENCVIGAGSVVTKDIPDNWVAYGNPCKLIKKNEKI
jgi:sugar O-acyltransferase (sialic acid O-acetyltransferase NeuD family)